MRDVVWAEATNPVTERKRAQRERDREAGWHDVNVRLPPGAAPLVKELAARLRREYLAEEA